MPKPTHVARQHLTKGNGVSDMTFAAAPGALNGDHQVLAVATFMGINVATPSGWTLLGTYAATTYTRATLFTRVLNAITAAAGFTVSSVSDVAAAEVRTLRGAASVAVVANGSGATTNTATVPAVSRLVHYWSAAFSNELGSQQGAISPSTGLEEATPQYTMNWFNGLVSGIDPTSPDTTAPTRTATKPAAASIQWVTVKIVGTVDTPVTLVEKIDAFAARVRTQFNALAPKTKFRGAWSPLSQVGVYDFANGLIPAAFTVLPPSYGGGTPVVADGNGDATSPSKVVYITGLAGGQSSGIQLTVPAGVTTIRWKWQLGGDLANWQAYKNGASVVTRSTFSNAFTQESMSVTTGDVIAWRGNDTGNNGGQWRLGYIELLASADPYMDGEYVIHDGKLWRSTVNNNASTPGANAQWVSALTSSGGGTSTAYDPVQLTVTRASATQTISAGSFTTVTYNNAPSVNVGGGTFSNGLWTVPTTGRYLILGSIRSNDSITARSLALGVHTSNGDGAWTTWGSFGGTGSFQRNNASYQRIDTFNAGDVLRMFVYSDGASVDLTTAKLTIDRIG